MNRGVLRSWWRRPGAAGSAAPPTNRGITARRAIGALAWAYLGFLVVAWLLFRFAGDRWWFATVLLFSPRWLFGAPLAALVPAALGWNRRAVWPLGLAALVVLWPIMGFCLPQPWQAAGDGPSLRIITCNVEGGDVARAALARLVRDAQPDLVALQEIAAEVGTQLEWPPEWHVVQEGQLIVASRYPLRDVRHSLRVHPQSPWPPVNALACVVASPQGDVGFCSVHLQSPREGLEKVLDGQTIVSPARSWALRTATEHRRFEAEELRAWIDQLGVPIIIAGDFNTPVESAIYRACWSPLANAFGTTGLGYGYTKITLKRGWQYGSRIDHILLGGATITCRDCFVGPDVGSDHLPLVADVVLEPSP